MTDRRRLGDAGERLAERRLLERGWVILDRQWRAPGGRGEIDLVALDGETLVIVEVKLRRGELFGAAEESVTPAKAQRLLTLGDAYVAAHAEHAERYRRVDLVAITLDRRGAIERFTHVENAWTDG